MYSMDRQARDVADAMIYWDRKKVRLFLDREFRRNPAIASILKNEVPVFTSNHAPFFACIPSNTKPHTQGN